MYSEEWQKETGWHGERESKEEEKWEGSGSGRGRKGEWGVCIITKWGRSGGEEWQVKSEEEEKVDAKVEVRVSSEEEEWRMKSEKRIWSGGGKWRMIMYQNYTILYLLSIIQKKETWK